MSLFVPPYTCVNQYRPISSEVLDSFQNLNSSSDPENFPQPRPAKSEVPFEADVIRAPICAFRAPVTSLRFDPDEVDSIRSPFI